MTKLLSIILSLIMTFLGSFAGNTAKLFMSGADVDTVTSVKNALSVNEDESNLYETVKYAAEMKNTVQGVFTDGDRTGFRMSNGSINLTQGLKTDKTATLTDKSGNEFAADTFKTFYTDKSGVRHYFETGLDKGRVNVIRLGEYYYDCHIRDFESGKFKVDKNYHVYGDRLYSQYSLYTEKENAAFSSFGTEIIIPASSVTDYVVDKENGYAAFIIRNVGVLGFIIPNDGSTEDYSVEKVAGNYVFVQTANCKDKKIPVYNSDEITEDNPPYITFGARIYTDGTSDFNGVKTAAFEEHNPLTDITVGQNNANCKYIGYDALRGAYTFTCDGTDFNVYYRNPEFQYNMPITIKGDDIDRNIYVRFNGKSGCLEAAAILDSDDELAPVDVEVCKNFCGDGGEDFYSKKDFQYGDSFAPLSVKKNSEMNFTMLNLYNGWGKYQLKQLSSIEFHVSYFHLSTGCTESNCIAPYSVSNTVNDGWLLPDFRTRSGNVWATQPQYNSVGCLKFMVNNKTYGEYAGTQIDSCGQCFADVTNYYSDVNGKYTYSLRHVEFPSNDENRTFYTIDVTFNEDVTYNNFKNDFSLFSFNGRFNAFNKLGYLGTDNNPTSVSAITGGKNVYYTLGTDKPYYSVYDATDETAAEIDKCFGCNFSFIVLDSEIVSNGKTINTPFAVRLNGTSTSTQSDITLDTEKISFKKGDTIKMNVILLPNGVGTEDEDTHTLSVRSENILSVNVKTGEATNDTVVPSVKAADNKAEFTVSGGNNVTAVRVDNITSCDNIVIYQLTGGIWTELDNSAHGYDGYSITTNKDGKYSVSFLYNSDGADATFRVEAGK